METFNNRFPADFISEALDQTRGWFYGLLAISTLLFTATEEERKKFREPINFSEDPSATKPPRVAELELKFADPSMPIALTPASNAGMFGKLLPRQPERPMGRQLRFGPHPYKTCIVLGLILGEDGNKMSKRLRNYKEPSYIFDSYGADAMRWYFFSAQAPWTSTRFTEANIRDSQKDFLVKLYNVLSFFNIYANIDGFEAIPNGAHGHRPTAQRGELDRWIISELQITTKTVREYMDRFENYPAARRLLDFADALSNWYVRRSRDRFWQGEKNQDKWDAYHTLYGCLWTLSKLLAPFTPFFAETMYQSLMSDPATKRPNEGDSVHLCDYPVADESLIDETLAAEMALVRDIVSAGRAARTAAKLRVRQPLALVEIILAKAEHRDWLADHEALIAEELNVKRVEFTREADKYVTYQIKPDFKAIGPKFGKLAPKIAATLQKVDAAASRRTLSETGELALSVEGQDVTLTPAEVEIRLDAKPGWSAAPSKAGVVVLATELTPELIEEGRVREVIHHVQAARKEMNLAYQARIGLFVETAAEFANVLQRHSELIRSECLVEKIQFEPPPANAHRESVDIDGMPLTLGIVA